MPYFALLRFSRFAHDKPKGLCVHRLHQRAQLRLRGEDPQAIADHLDSLRNPEGELFPLFKTAAETALAQSREQYKLH